MIGMTNKTIFVDFFFYINKYSKHLNNAVKYVYTLHAHMFNQNHQNIRITQ